MSSCLFVADYEMEMSFVVPLFDFVIHHIIFLLFSDVSLNW